MCRFLHAAQYSIMSKQSPYYLLTTSVNFRPRNPTMSLFDAMKPGNGDKVESLIREGQDVNSKNNLGMSVIQHAANEYSYTIGLKGNLTAEAQELALEWAQTVDPLMATGQVRYRKVTSQAWNSPSLSDSPTALDIAVDAMCHELAYSRSEIAGERGYKRRREAVGL